MWGGDNRNQPMIHLFEAIGMGCRNYDAANGPQCDLADNITFAQVEFDTLGGEYVACTASPECGAFSRDFTTSPDRLLGGRSQGQTGTVIKRILPQTRKGSSYTTLSAFV